VFPNRNKISPLAPAGADLQSVPLYIVWHGLQIRASEQQGAGNKKWAQHDFSSFCAHF